MKNEVNFSIIIVSYNTTKLIENCLNSIFKSLNMTNLSYEVIVVDNGSTDGTVVMIEKKFPNVFLIKNNSNFGFGKANNQGAKIASGKYLLFLNSDTEVLNNAIVKLYAFIDKIDANVLCGGKLFNLDKSPQASCGPEYSLKNIFRALLLKGDYVGKTRYSPNKIKDVDWIMGACMIMPKKLFISVGGFDENIFMYMEEIDLQYRLKKMDVMIKFYPEAHFIHVGAASGEGRNKAILNVFKGLRYFYKKHHNIAQNFLLQLILVFKSITAFILFSILLNKNKQKLYIEAFKVAIQS